MSIFVAIT